MLKATVFLICYIPVVFLWEMFHYKKGKTHRGFKGWFFDLCFYIYIFLLVRVTIFPVPYQKNELETLREMFGSGLENNIVPFCSIITILRGGADFSVKLRQLGGNLILLVPLAFYMPFAGKKFQRAGNVLLLLIICSCAIEVVQFVIGKMIGYNYRVVDIDDVILNVCGGMTGYLAWRVVGDGGLKNRPVL